MGRPMLHLLPKIGDTFGRWTVCGEPVFQDHRWQISCRCLCSVERLVDWSSLYHGDSTSCGCYKAERAMVHGGWKEPLYKTWHNMIQRCYYRKGPRFADYGGRGIKVCDEWGKPHGYPAFREWALANGYREGLTIERKDVDGDYCPDNCEWIPLVQQSRNVRDTLYVTIDGHPMRFMDFTDDPRRVVSRSAVRVRIRKLGWDPERALTTPARPARSPR